MGCKRKESRRTPRLLSYTKRKILPLTETGTTWGGSGPLFLVLVQGEREGGINLEFSHGHVKFLMSFRRPGGNVNQAVAGRSTGKTSELEIHG